MKRKNVNMLSGPLLKNMAVFAIPVMLTDALGMLFHSTDLIVVGQFCGSHAIAAVGATTKIVNFVVTLFLGIAVGFGVVLSHALGENNDEKISRTVHTGLPFAFVLGAILTVVGLVFSRKLLEITDVPADIIDDANLYLKIYFSGVILRMMQAFLGPIFRATGDSRTPLLYLTFGSVLNVIFNLIFVLGFGMTVDGVAWGTVISEGTSSILAIILLMKRTDKIKFTPKKMCFDLDVVKRTIQIGFPSGLQSSMFSLSAVILSSAINSFGSATIAASSATNNITGLIAASTTGFCQSVNNFTGQNFGAGNMERVKKIAKTGLILAVSTMFVLGITVDIFSKPLLSLYITDNKEAILIGQQKLYLMGTLQFVLTARNIITSALQGIGDSRRPLLVSIFTICIFKIVWLYTVFRIPALHTYMCLMWSFVISWALDIVCNGAVLLKDWKRIEKKAIKNARDKKREENRVLD